jgi:hypothetical protein
MWVQGLLAFLGHIGAGAALILVALILLWTVCMVWLVLRACKSTQPKNVKVHVRPLPWPRIEITVESPPSPNTPGMEQCSDPPTLDGS